MITLISCRKYVATIKKDLERESIEITERRTGCKATQERIMVEVKKK